jgi:hypothetical protein
MVIDGCLNSPGGFPQISSEMEELVMLEICCLHATVGLLQDMLCVGTWHAWEVSGGESMQIAGGSDKPADAVASARKQ